MGFGAALSALTGVAGGVMQYQASRAAEKQAHYQAALQDRQAADERETLKTNLERKRADRARYLARVALEQANSGARSDTGTPLAVLGEIQSRLDEEIYDFGEAAMARIGQLQAGAAMSRYGAAQERAARPVAAFGSLLKTAASTYSAWDRASYRKAPGG